MYVDLQIPSFAVQHANIYQVSGEDVETGQLQSLALICVQSSYAIQPLPSAISGLLVCQRA